MDTSNILGSTVQTQKLYFDTPKPGEKKNVFKVRIKNGVLGNIPSVMSGDCSIIANGLKSDDTRGVATFKGYKGYFSTVKVGLSDDCAGDVLELCRTVLGAWKESYPPITRSSWYQNHFGFSDGTQVHLGTGAIDNPDLYANYSFSNQYEGPTHSFFNAMYGDEENGKWYTAITIPTLTEGAWNEEDVRASNLIFRGEDGKSIKTKLGQDCPTIPASGIPLHDTDTIKAIEQSKWFKETRWTCKTVVQLKSITWITDIDVTSNNKVMYPVFSFSTYGNILFKRSPYVLPEGVIPQEQRMAIFNAALFEGVDAPPTKKRKRTNVDKRKSKPTDSVGDDDVDYETEMLLASDIEGDKKSLDIRIDDVMRSL